VGDGELLIPVTGIEAPFSSADQVTKSSVYVETSSSFGLLMFGFGLVFHGAALIQGRKEKELVR
jgi:hypothetical protein